MIVEKSKLFHLNSNHDFNSNAIHVNSLPMFVKPIIHFYHYKDNMLKNFASLCNSV